MYTIRRNFYVFPGFYQTTIVLTLKSFLSFNTEVLHLVTNIKLLNAFYIEMSNA